MLRLFFYLGGRAARELLVWARARALSASSAVAAAATAARKRLSPHRARQLLAQLKERLLERRLVHGGRGFLQGRGGGRGAFEGWGRTAPSARCCDVTPSEPEPVAPPCWMRLCVCEARATFAVRERRVKEERRRAKAGGEAAAVLATSGRGCFQGRPRAAEQRRQHLFPHTHTANPTRIIAHNEDDDGEEEATKKNAPRRRTKPLLRHPHHRPGCFCTGARPRARPRRRPGSSSRAPGPSSPGDRS